MAVFYGCCLTNIFLFQYNVVKGVGVCLNSDVLSTYIHKGPSFLTLDSYLVVLVGSKLGIMIFLKMSPRTHHNYL